MLRLSKVLTLSTQVGLTLVALAVAGGVRDVQASPVCNVNTFVLAGNDFIADSLLTPGVCVQLQDKLYGNFNFGNLPAGFVVFTFVPGMPEQHSITFSGG